MVFASFVSIGCFFPPSFDFSAGLGVLNMAVQAVSRMAGNSDSTARNQFFLIDKDVKISFKLSFINSCISLASFSFDESYSTNYIFLTWIWYDPCSCCGLVSSIWPIIFQDYKLNINWKKKLFILTYHLCNGCHV